jgi:hypothetical protein
VFILLTGFFQYFHQPAIYTEDINETGPQVVDININHIVGEQIDIQAKIEPIDYVETVDVIILTEDGSLIVRETLTPSSLGEIFYIYQVSHPAIRINSELSIGFEFRLSNGTLHTIELANYLYDDTRFKWQSQETDGFKVFWYQDDPDLGLKIISAVREGLTQVNQLVELPPPEGISIYAYDTVVDLQEILKYSGEVTSWVASHADPVHAMMVVSLPPGSDQDTEIGQQIPHELVHILLYQKLGEGYQTIPRWLNEGLATSAEITPDPVNNILLKKAYERGSLLPIESLCDGFPIDAANFQLAYAEAADFTMHLHDAFGKEKIGDLLQVYSQGHGCDQGVLEVYQLNLKELEKDWRQKTFAEPPGLSITPEIISFFILIGAAFIVPLSLITIGVWKRMKG